MSMGMRYLEKDKAYKIKAKKRIALTVKGIIVKAIFAVIFEKNLPNSVFIF